MPQCSARQRTHPVGDSVGVHDSDLEASVVRTSILEDFDPAEEAADVADEDAARVSRVPRSAVDCDLGLERLRAQALRPCPDVCDSAESILEAAVCLLDPR